MSYVLSAFPRGVSFPDSRSVCGSGRRHTPAGFAPLSGPGRRVSVSPTSGHHAFMHTRPYAHKEISLDFSGCNALGENITNDLFSLCQPRVTERERPGGFYLLTMTVTPGNVPATTPRHLPHVASFPAERGAMGFRSGGAAWGILGGVAILPVSGLWGGGVASTAAVPPCGPLWRRRHGSWIPVVSAVTGSWIFPYRQGLCPIVQWRRLPPHTARQPVGWSP